MAWPSIGRPFVQSVYLDFASGSVWLLGNCSSAAVGATRNRTELKSNLCKHLPFSIWNAVQCNGKRIVIEIVFNVRSPLGRVGGRAGMHVSFAVYVARDVCIDLCKHTVSKVHSFIHSLIPPTSHPPPSQSTILPKLFCSCATWPKSIVFESGSTNTLKFTWIVSTRRKVLP